jgi:O-acetyl-ADP-ribose deacetylase (regulator of RNase III)
MKYKEVYKDLFTVPDYYYLAHCIASDLRMGAGIAVKFQKKFSLRKELEQYNVKVGSCILVDRVFNLITKSRSSGKPTYKTLESSLIEMKQIIIDNDIKYLAMPKIGCGLDRLQWGRVSEMLKEIFSDYDIDIIICIQ